MMGTGLAAASDNIVTGKATVMSLGKRILLVRGVVWCQGCGDFVVHWWS